MVGKPGWCGPQPKARTRPGWTTTRLRGACRLTGLIRSVGRTRKRKIVSAGGERATVPSIPRAVLWIISTRADARGFPLIYCDSGRYPLGRDGRGRGGRTGRARTGSERRSAPIRSRHHRPVWLGSGLGQTRTRPACGIALLHRKDQCQSVAERAAVLRDLAVVRFAYKTV